MIPLEKNILQHLKNRGGQPFITGGTVRDKQLGSDVRDMDVVVFGMDEDVLRRELKHFGQVLTYGKSFRVYQVRGLAVEFSLPRNKKSHEKAPLKYQLQRDAEGRDFTVNALYMDPLTEELFDPLNGLEDLRKKRLRMASKHTFEDDSLRVLRAIQLCARMGFSVEGETLEAMSRTSLDTVAVERVYDELNKWLLSPNPARGWEIMKAAGQVPALCTLAADDHQVVGDVLTTAVSLRHQSKTPVLLMWSALLAVCMLAEPTCHEQQGEDEMNNRFINPFGELSNHHDHTNYVAGILWGMTRFRQYAMRKPDVVRLGLAVNLDELLLAIKALTPYWQYAGMTVEVNQAVLRIQKGRPLQQITPLVRGRDLKRWGFGEGKEMGTLLEIAFQLQLEGVTKDQIEVYFKKHQRLLGKRGH